MYLILMKFNVHSHTYPKNIILISAVPSSILLDWSRRSPYPEPCTLGALYSSPLATALPEGWGTRTRSPPGPCPHIEPMLWRCEIRGWNYCSNSPSPLPRLLGPLPWCRVSKSHLYRWHSHLWPTGYPKVAICGKCKHGLDTQPGVSA